MRIHNNGRDREGFEEIWARVLRFRYMITEAAKERCRILAFWEKHGDEAAKEAFGVSLRTLFRWQKELLANKGRLESLNKKSTAPKGRRKRTTSEGISLSIIELRREHPRLGKEKIHALLKQKGYSGSVSTVGRIMSDLKNSGTLPNPVRVSMQARTGNIIERTKKRKKKLRRPKGYRVLEVDTVIRFVDGLKRYIVTGIDTEKRTAFSAAYTNHGSRSAADFLRKCSVVLPDCPQAVQTDNGSEFAKYFDLACASLGKERFHTHVRSPKENAHVERFNRTLDEEFLVWHRALMRDDMARFNEKLIDWLVWYNAERPHFALGQQAPLRAMMSSLEASECHMWWTHTCA